MFQVAYIGNVPDVPYPVPQMGEVTIEDVENDRLTGMSKMCITVNGGTTGIETDKRRIQRLKSCFLPCKGIVNDEIIGHNPAKIVILAFNRTENTWESAKAKAAEKKHSPLRRHHH
jgi:hypothetical protein